MRKAIRERLPRVCEWNQVENAAFAAFFRDWQRRIGKWQNTNAA